MTHTFLVRSALLAVVALAGAGAIWFVAVRPEPAGPAVPPAEVEDLAPGPSPADPRLTSDTVFRNVNPAVRYIGDARCAGCHGDICTSYHAHPMGRSASAVTDASPLEKYDAGSNNPWKVGGYEFRATKTAGGAHHGVTAKDRDGSPLPEYGLPATVAIGSGTRGRSFLSVEDGSVWQSPLSWFSAESRWDVSPGFDLGNGGRRAITAACLFCHVNHVEPVPHAVNRYREPLFAVQTAIGCERCHGPGELHANERASGTLAAKVDTSIVNPKHLSNPLQAAICQQCHLQGQERVARRGRDESEFRPGLPLADFVTVFVRPPEIADLSRSVGQFEQLEQSRCKTANGGQLLCTSCHDPHKSPAPAERDQFYNGRCATCHQTKGCTAPVPDRQAKNDRCATCHMPRGDSSNIAHTSITDHRVLRRPVAAAPPRGLPRGAVPLVAFHGGGTLVEPELDRDLGIALTRLAQKLPLGSGTQQLVGRMARDRLTAAVGVWRGDVPAWLALSRAHASTGEPNDRLVAAERAARLAPESEAALAEVAEAALGVSRFDRAEQAVSVLIANNPRSVDYLLTRASIASSRKQWEKAEQDCRAALRIQPLHPTARLVLAVALDRRGDRDAGKKEAETAVGLATNPPQQKAFWDWYQQETR